MKIHIVQKGDTLWKIAKQYGVDFEELKASNPQLASPDMIMPGMKIKIPSGKQMPKEQKQKQTLPKSEQKQKPKADKVPPKKEVKKEHPVPPKHPFLTGEEYEEVEIEIPQQPKNNKEKPKMDLQKPKQKPITYQPKIKMPYTKDDLYIGSSEMEYCKPGMKSEHPYYEMKQKKQAVKGQETFDYSNAQCNNHYSTSNQNYMSHHQFQPEELHPQQVQPMVQYIPVYMYPINSGTQHCNCHHNHPITQHQQQYISPQHLDMVHQHQHHPHSEQKPYTNDKHPYLKPYPQNQSHQIKHYIDESCYREDPIQPPSDTIRENDQIDTLNDKEEANIEVRDSAESGNEPIQQNDRFLEDIFDYSTREVRRFSDVPNIGIQHLEE